MLSGSRLTGVSEAGRRRIGGPLVGGGQGGWAPRAEASPQTSCGRTGDRSPQQPFAKSSRGEVQLLRILFESLESFESSLNPLNPLNPLRKKIQKGFKELKDD